jgi:hypothetical protein
MKWFDSAIVSLPQIDIWIMIHQHERGRLSKRAILCDAQFRETKLRNVVLIEANCEKANFKLADLRGANLSEAKLIETNFEGAQVHGTILTEAETRDIPETQVDVSAAADGSEMLPVREWLSQHGLTQPGRAS